MHGRPLLLVVALTTMLLVACQPPPRGARVLVLGDSLTAEARESGEGRVRLGAFRTDWAGAIYGSAPCDGIAAMKKVAHQPDVVVVAYSGNSYPSRCMEGEAGAALTARYVADITAIVRHFDNGRTRIVLVGAPVRMDIRADADAVFVAVRNLASRLGVTFVDGGANLTPGRTFRATGACLADERTCGTAGRGRNVLRSDDRVHFCPGRGPELSGACPGGYSSGAVRYTRNLLTAINLSSVPS